MRQTLQNVDPSKLTGAKTLKDSINFAMEYNLSKAMNISGLNEDEDISVDINKTVVMIAISDKMLWSKDIPILEQSIQKNYRQLGFEYIESNFGC